VLIHGSGHTAHIWDGTVRHLSHRALAVDLPGRRYRPADLTLGTLEASSAAAAGEVEAAGPGPVVLVGHSSGGTILPAVAARLGPRVTALVFVAGLVAPDGGQVVDIVAPDQRQALDDNRKASCRRYRGHTFSGFAAGETGAEMAAGLAVIDDSRVAGGVESLNLMFQTVSWDGVAPSLPRIFIRCLQDRIQPRDMQGRLIAAAGATEVIDLNTGHTPAQSAPVELAAILDSIAARHPGRG
jgi:pimeloyl-ACP methyl ester carboxylesterase